MRPLKLEIEGFTAFRSRTCLDLEELDLFAITGPTGAGKSSLIDAICYALYGRIPRVTSEVASCISQGLDRMSAMLEFRANGRPYRVYRETRRKGQGNVRLELFDGDDWQPVADRGKDVTTRIEEIIGLDYESFIRSALLPQGEFQEFLAGNREQRRKVLENLLRIDVYGRMQTRANQEAAQLKYDADQIDQRLREELADATPETLERLQRELRGAEKESKRRAAEIEVLQRGVALGQRLAGARNDLESQTRTCEEALQRLQEAQALAEGGDAQLRALRAELETVRTGLAENGFDAELLTQLSVAANLALSAEKSLKNLKDAESKLLQLEKEAASAEEAARGAAAAAEKARSAVVAAEHALEDARRHDLAASLQSGLKPGDLCPVCGGVIESLPDVSGSDLVAAQAKHEQARRQDESARKTAAGAETRAKVATSGAEQAKEQLTGLRAQAEDDSRKLEEALPGIEDRSSATIRFAIEGQKALKLEREELQGKERRLAGEVEQEEKRVSGAREAVLTATAQYEAAVSMAETARTRAEEAARELATVAAGQGWTDASALIEAGRDPLPRLQALAAETVARETEANRLAGRLESDIEKVERNILVAEQLREELKTKKAGCDVAADLGQMLRADRFQAYLQREALRSLAREGSRRLLDLSNQRYELDVPEGGQDFLVRDRWNADDTRSVRTLSGGETFLASLALALALAETLPGLAPGRRLALESIFLDEGFGSLDPEALDRAADALDALRMEDRLVCVVTHLKDLADRMPAQVVVSKSETGSSVAVA
jgi:exonuclease SbcC